jgi:hypothetical protein
MLKTLGLSLRKPKIQRIEITALKRSPEIADGLPPNAVYELGKVVYLDDPPQAARNYGFKEPIDAFIDGGQPVVAPPAKFEAKCVTSGTHRWAVLDAP